MGDGISNQSWKPENRELLLTPPLTHHHQVDASPKSYSFLTWVPLQYTNSSPSPSLSFTLVLSLNYLYPSPEILVFYCFLASNSFLSSLFSMLQPEWLFFQNWIMSHLCKYVCVCVCTYICMFSDFSGTFFFTKWIAYWTHYELHGPVLLMQLMCHFAQEFQKLYIKGFRLFWTRNPQEVQFTCHPTLLSTYTHTYSRNKTFMEP